MNPNKEYKRMIGRYLFGQIDELKGPVDVPPGSESVQMLKPRAS